MKPVRRLNRRSFLGQVAGGAATIGALGLIGGRARAQTGPYTGVTDTDSGSHADNAGHGRGPGGNASGQPQPPGPQTGVTDSDPTDPVGGGRGGHTGYSDSDSGANADPSGRGRRGQEVQTGLTDSDPVDASGQGRGTSGQSSVRSSATRPDGTRVYYSGVTDTDSGATRDPANYGRGGRECRDSDQQSANWQHRDPVRRCE